MVFMGVLLAELIGVALMIVDVVVELELPELGQRAFDTMTVSVFPGNAMMAVSSPVHFWPLADMKLASRILFEKILSRWLGSRRSIGNNFSRPGNSTRPQVNHMWNWCWSIRSFFNENMILPHPLPGFGL